MSYKIWKGIRVDISSTWFSNFQCSNINKYLKTIRMVMNVVQIHNLSATLFVYIYIYIILDLWKRRWKKIYPFHSCPFESSHQPILEKLNWK
jgi:hypothetical protein